MTRARVMDRPPLRVSLQRPDSETAAALEPWFARCWREIRGGSLDATQIAPPDLHSWLSDGDGATPLIVVLKSETIGFLSHAASRGGVTIHALAIVPMHRNLGYGAEAVYALEALAPARGSVTALVPLANGLAIYFWLRIGYHPRFAAGVPASAVTAMVRST